MEAEKMDVNGLGRPEGKTVEEAHKRNGDSINEVVMEDAPPPPPASPPPSLQRPTTPLPPQQTTTPPPPPPPKTPPPRPSTPAFLSDSDSTSSLSPAPSDTNIDLSIVRPPPSKKRQVGESPPWKSATTQTPTSFIEGGRRKSGRVHHLAKELQEKVAAEEAAAAAAAAAATRANKRSVNGTPSKSSPGRVKNTYGSPSSARRGSAAPNGRSTNTNGTGKSRGPKKRRTTLSPSPEIRDKKRATFELSESEEEPVAPARSRKGGKASAGKAPAPSGSRRSARAAKKAEEAEVAAAEARLKAQSDARRRKNRKSSGGDGGLEESDEYAFNFSSSDGDVETNSTWKRPFLKLIVKPPPRSITSHVHVLPKPKFASFAEFCDSEELANNPEELEAAEEAAREEAEIRARIEEAGRTGILAPEKRTYGLPEKQPEPPRTHAHQDYLIAHALQLRKLMDREKRQLMQLAKKVVYQCAAKVREAQPKTREELEEEEEIQNIKMYKETVGAVKKKWALIQAEVEQRRIQRKIEEERLEGEKNLKKMLEQSSKLLARRVRGGSEAGDGEDDMGESLGEDGEEEEEDLDAEMDREMMTHSDIDPSDVDEDEDGSADGEDDEDDEDEEMLSDSGDEDEDTPGAGADDDDDSKLTVEELRAKYARLAEEAAKAEAEASSAEKDGDEDMPDASAGESDTPSTHHHTRKSALAQLLDDDANDSILDEDEDDESVVMDSELDDDEDDDEGSEEESGSESEGGYGGLASFYSDLYGSGGGQDDEEEEEEQVQAEESAEAAVEKKGEAEAAPASQGETAAAQDTAKAQTDSQPAKGAEEQPAANTEEPKDVVAEQDPTTPAPAPHDAAGNEAAKSFQQLQISDKAASEPAQTNGVEEHAMEIDSETKAVEKPSVPSSKEESAEGKEVAVSPKVAELPPDIKTPVPFLLRGTLRAYQHYGLDWLAGLYENKTNGILADEMGLGKTIQTIALLSHLACEKEVWGPHLVVVPTSVILNWEMEFKKWAPGFKILTYYGSREERQAKRRGWLNDNLWHVCITSYQLVIQDATIFKRRNWHYLILDEAHNIKNFRSQRWQTLLNFKANSRLLLTGTPLQNNLVELWSLLYFLMPSGVSSEMPTGFANLKEFQEWFARPVDQIIEHGRSELDEEAKHTVQKLHQVLRPYLLRRLKADVEKQMPAKYEHIITCRLSKRQRFLYDEFMSLAKTRETLVSGNYLSIINCLMQLRKVCNHPDLFETRQIVTSFATSRSVVADFEIKDFLVRKRLLEEDERNMVNLDVINLVPVNKEKYGAYEAYEVARLADHRSLMGDYDAKIKDVDFVLKPNLNTVRGNLQVAENRRKLDRLDTLKQAIYLNRYRTDGHPIYGSDVIGLCAINTAPLAPEPPRPRHLSNWYLNYSDTIRDMIPTLPERALSLSTTIEKFSCVTPPAVCTDLPELTLTPDIITEVRSRSLATPYDPFHESRVRLSIAFPDKRLLQYDCGKLQHLATLLRDLQAGGHRALIFTQMTKVLDILEQFLNIHGYRYLRLDGATKVEQRQILTDRFNNDPRILVFILSTRSGGLGINLTGADTVIFYDMDWNPAMDKQCQDRCHRIGQTRDVHIYRFVSEHTIESNILKKANQKRMLDDVVIQEGEFTTDYFTKLDIRDMLDGLPIQAPSPSSSAEDGDEDGEDAGGEDGENGGKRKTPKTIVLPPPPPSSIKDIEKALEAAEDDEDAAAAKVAAREIQDADVADFVEDRNRPSQKDTQSQSQSKSQSQSQHSSSSQQHQAATHSQSQNPKVDTPQLEAGTPAATTEAGEGGEGEEEGDEGEHVDEYMIRFMEWELADVPVVIPQGRDRSKKNSKKAKIRY